MAHKLGVFWTVLPDSVEYIPPSNPDGGPLGGGGGIIGPSEGGEGPPPVLNIGIRRLKFSATVAFRLVRSNGSAAGLPLSNFQPVVDWPATLQSATFGLTFSDDEERVFEPTLISAPESSIWSALFPSTLNVLPQNPVAYDPRVAKEIRSYPRPEMKRFVRSLHAGSQYDAAPSPTAVVNQPIPATVLQSRFSPIRQLRTQPNLASLVEARLKRTPATPADWAFTRADRSSFVGNSPLATQTLQSATDFVQLRKYYRRLLDDATAPEPMERPELKSYDFHQLAAMALLQPPVARALGLILDFTLDVPDFVGGDGNIRLTADYPAEDVERADVFYRTAFHLDNERFEIPARDPLYDAQGRYLLLGTDSFDIEDGIDVDSAALKADESEQTFDAAPQAEDLPALKTTGIGINRVDHARKLGDARQRDLERFNNAFGSDLKVVDSTLSQSNVAADPAFVNYAEDLIRGFRFDVYDVSRGRWYSLHKRSGQYIIGRDPEVGLDVANLPENEGFMSIVPLRPKKASKTQDDPADEYYLSESIMRWGGWSLSVPRIGSPIANGDTVLPRENNDPNGKRVFERPTTTLGSVVTDINTAHELPRLRFGSSYMFRARVVDTAGNSVPFEKDTAPISLGDALSEEVMFRRYDPIESPTLVYRSEPVPGETIHELVVRSEDVNDTSDGEVRRLVPPPATSQWIAECHGMFDVSIHNGHDAATAQYNALLRDREGKSWSDSPLSAPLAGGTPGEFKIPVQGNEQSVVVPYLPDPAAKSVLIQNLPGTHGRERITYADGDWPSIRPGEIKLVKGDGYAGPGAYLPVPSGGSQLAISLHKGDVHTIGLSHAPGGQLAHLFGLYQWAVDESSRQNPDLDPNEIADGIRRGVADGDHRSISPIQVVKLIHAVRKPTAPPIFQTRGVPVPGSWRVGRHLGETQAFPTGEIGYSPRSTGRLDVRAVWDDYRDAGPGGPNPTIPIRRGAPVFSRELDRSQVPEGLFPDLDGAVVATGDAIQEFGDTHHYRSTYFPKATTAFLQYFREVATVDFGGTGFTRTFSARPVSEAPVHVIETATGRNCLEGEDYTLNRQAGTITRRPAARNPISGVVSVSFVPGVIDWEGAGETIDVLSTARPKPPLVHSIVPMFRWNRSVVNGVPKRIQSTRSGGGLRVWLDRPWWSSGEGEQLGVVVTRYPLGEPDPSEKFCSQAGADPMTSSRDADRLLRATDFAGNEPAVAVSLAENGRRVDVVPYTVQFDAQRDQWYADIEVNPSVSGKVGYFPFVKLMLVRYQPYSMKTGEFAPDSAIEQTVSLSSVVATDFVQVAPQRDVTVSKTRGVLTVTVSGESYKYMQNENTPLNQVPTGRGPSRVTAKLQRRNAAISDPVLAWEDVTIGSSSLPVHAELKASGPTDNVANYTWTGTLRLPVLPARTQAPEYRVLVEEFEVHYADTDHVTGTGQNAKRIPGGTRCVFQDMVSFGEL